MNHHLSDFLRSNREAIADSLVSREMLPESARRHSPRHGGRRERRCREDALCHLSLLAEAIAAETPSLLSDYLAWANLKHARYQTPDRELSQHLRTMQQVVGEWVPDAWRSMVQTTLDQSLRRIAEPPEEVPSAIDLAKPGGKLARDYLQELLGGDRNRACSLVLKAAEEGMSVTDLYLHVFQPALYEIGRLWQMNLISVAQEHYCSAATQLIMSQFYPRIFSGKKPLGRFVGTCVSGELHEIGIRMVADLLELSGWNTHYLGANTPHAGVLETVRKLKANLLGISATLSCHVGDVKQLIRRVRAEAQCSGVKILVGGYPFNMAPNLWRYVGSDDCAHDAGEAVLTARRLLGKPHESRA